MNKNIFLGFALAFCVGVSAPLLADVPPAPENPANITAPVTSTTEHQAAAELHKKHAAYHNAMAEHYKNLVAAEYKASGHHDLKKHYKTIAAHHKALSKEHQKAADVHEKMAQ